MLIFIGAGVSKLFGIPDMKGFTDIFDKDTDISSDEVYCGIKRSFEGARARFEEGFDLEVLMTVLDDLGRDEDELWRRMSPQTAKFLFRNFSQINHLQDMKVRETSRLLLGRIKRIIVSECLKADGEKQQKVTEVYDGLMQALSRHEGNDLSGDKKINYPSRLKIFTTNYDRCIETYLGIRQIDFTQGLNQRFGYNAFDVSSYEDEGTEHYVKVFKLHGSVDLFNIDGVVRQRRHGETIGEEVVYFPIEFGGYNRVIESPYLELFYLFRKELDDERRWIIAGTSLRDRTICSIMNDVIRLKSEKERPRILFINPDQGVIDRVGTWGYSHLKDRLIPISNDFGLPETYDSIMKKL